MKKRIIYVSQYIETCQKSHKQMLNDNEHVIDLYLNDKNKKCWGDDWDDDPAYCNSGSPYAGGEYGEITRIKVRLGDLCEIKDGKLIIDLKVKK